MNFVSVQAGGESRRSGVSYEEPIIRLTRRSLISLIAGLESTYPGFDTMKKVELKIKNYRAKNIDPLQAKLFADSGGYSIIVGQIPPDKINLAIGCYTKYFETCRDDIDYIFSLDIPLTVNPKYDALNTKDNIYSYNLKSLRESIIVMNKYGDELWKKFYFIWQLFSPNQYDIWKKLYKELDDEFHINKHLRNSAVGGMVSLRGRTGINYSPFIGIAYRCFFDYLNAGNFDHPFRLHLLGINIDDDRFIIVLLEKIFNIYLEVTKAEFTYDTINYFRNTNFNFKKMEVFDIFNGEMIRYQDIFHVPESLWSRIYGDYLHEKVLSELDRSRNAKTLHNAAAFVPLGINTEISKDRFYKEFIDRNHLAEIIIQSKTLQRVKHEVNHVFDNLDGGDKKVISAFTIDSIKKEIKIIFRFHDWLRNSRDEEKLDSMLTGYINDIGAKQFIR